MQAIKRLVCGLLAGSALFALPRQASAGETECTGCTKLVCTASACCLVNPDKNCICDCEPIDD